MTTGVGYDLAYDYTVRFYPRFFTWTQFQISAENSQRSGGAAGANLNRLTGPLGMGPEYRIVVAINDDTVYAEAFIDVSNGPVILTVPPYPTYHYSVLQLDVYGTIFDTAFSSNPPKNGGVYAFVDPTYQGQLPQNAVRVNMPWPLTTMAIRIDRYYNGTDVTEQADEFRRTLAMQPLAQYNADPTKGKTILLPLSTLAPSVKLMADEGLAKWPEAFLTTLQDAMASPTTKPITPADQQLIDDFNAAFKSAQDAVNTNPRLISDIIGGAQAAFAALINRWQSHRGTTNWVHFDNIGRWLPGSEYLDRAALTEYIQVGNDRDAAYYANAFVDGSGVPLDGASFKYTLTFEPGTLPQYERFWSLTAYTPETIELVPNSANKYVVASYTKNLVTTNGVLTLYIQADQPSDDRFANWLPVPKSPFSVLFRVYGPQGSAKAGTYVLPKIHRVV